MSVDTAEGPDEEIPASTEAPMTDAIKMYQDAIAAKDKRIAELEARLWERKSFDRNDVIEECAKFADLCAENAASETGQLMALGIAKNMRAVLAVTSTHQREGGK